MNDISFSESEDSFFPHQAHVNLDPYDGYSQKGAMYHPHDDLIDVDTQQSCGIMCLRLLCINLLLRYFVILAPFLDVGPNKLSRDGRTKLRTGVGSL